jgi:(p)ppGpp synthase/HD superfamily hydrolase
MTLVEHAIRRALEAHAGQKEENGRPYLLHPLRLMLRMDTEQEMAAAVLHDVVEDTDTTIENLRADGFPEEVLAAVALLTHDTKRVSYRKYIERIAADPVARKVKLADLEDNLNVLRLGRLGVHESLRLKLYFEAWHTLQERQPPPRAPVR